MKISRRKIIDRRSPLQKAIQQDARKTANCLRRYRTKVLRKISAIKARTELRPELARQIPAHGDANLPFRIARLRRDYGPRVQKFSPRRLLDEIWRRVRTKWTPRRGATNSAQNGVLKERNGTRLKKNQVRPYYLCVHAAPASIDGRFQLSFRRSRLPTDAYASL